MGSSVHVEAKYFINFIEPVKRFVLSLHCNGSNSLLFVNATKIYQFKVKDSKNKKYYALCLGNISKEFTIHNMKKNRIERNCNFFSIDPYCSIDTNEILGIHNI